MNFGEKMTLIRKQKKLSQAELGKRSGINGDIVVKYERNEMKPSIETAKKLANALGVSSDYLTNGTPDDLAESSLADKELLNQFKSIEKLPEADKNVVKVFLDAFITKKKLKQLAL
nr:helix-turn-helix transcriptional regulator [uncultured Draconibacterium sp.]